jgi:hypothetical protein
VIIGKEWTSPIRIRRPLERRCSENSGIPFTSFFPIDTLDRAAVDGFLDLLLGSPCRVMNLRKILVVQAKDFRANLSAKTARDAFILVDHGNSGHSLLPP